MHLDVVSDFHGICFSLDVFLGMWTLEFTTSNIMLSYEVDCYLMIVDRDDDYILSSGFFNYLGLELG